MGIPTKERLAQVLHAAGLFEMEKRAREGLYDDFQSDVPCPIMLLVTDLKLAGHDNLAHRAMHGEWDGTKEEAERWERSPEGRAVIREFSRSEDQEESQ